MNYDAAVRYLLSLGRELAAPTQAAAAKFDLENINILAERLGRPDRAYPSAHIAGTNGKGSTAAFLESILRRAGFRTGLNTSPHLEKINERIRVNGEEISDDAFAETFTRIQALNEELLAAGKLRAHPTYFECVTAMAFEYFARERVDFGVFEVGLGGRLDATNILTPVVSIITRVDFDHENFLGHSLTEIAAEKAGILKPSVPLILAEQRPEALEVDSRACPRTGLPASSKPRPRSASRRNGWKTVAAAPCHRKSNPDGRLSLLRSCRANSRYKTASTPLPPRGTFRSAAIAFQMTRLRRESPEPCGPAVSRSCSRIRTCISTARTIHRRRENLPTFLEQNLAGRKIWLVFGALRDKAVDEIAGVLFPHAAEVIFTQPRTTRAISVAQLAEITSHHAAHFTIVPEPEAALEYALDRAEPHDAVIVAGSLYLVGQLRHYWKNRAQVAAR